jgi:integral membrane protein (TIGR00529 family)
MYELFCMGLALAVFVVLLHCKFKLGRAMILAAVMLEILLAVWPGQLYDAFIEEWYAKPLDQTTGYLFVTLTMIVNLVNVMGLAMNEAGISHKLISSLQNLFKSRRLAMCTIPLLMGLLPTPGGIMLSAPMVRDLSDSIGVSRKRSAAINFFFRHQWESIWPLFPAVPLIQAMLGISAAAMISRNILITIFGLIGGTIFLLLIGIPPRSQQELQRETWLESLKTFLHAFWPIALVAVLYMALNINPAIGILISLAFFGLVYKISPVRWGKLFKLGFEMDFVLLILGALLFKLNLQAGDGVGAVVRFFTEINMPTGILLFVLPMIVAALTGLTMPTVAITFPLLLPFIGTGTHAQVGLQTLAFSGLLCGLYLTPVHLCLSLSASYFEAPLGKILWLLIGPISFIAAAGILAAMIG